MKVLHVCANPKPTDESVSKQLAMAFFIKLTSLNSDVEVDNVDLDAEPPPPYSYDQFRYSWFPATIKGYVPTAEEEASGAYAREQAARFNAADVLVLTMPMWNNSVPGAFKMWLDHVLAPGLVYNRSGEKLEKLHKIKRAILIVASGDTFQEGDARDALTPVVEHALANVGIDELSLAWADGQDPARHTDSASRKEMATEAVEEHAEEVAAAQVASTR